MSGEHEVFEDALLSLGFEERNLAHTAQYIPRKDFDRLFGEDFPGSRGVHPPQRSMKGDPASTIEVQLFQDHVTLQWVTSWIRPPAGFPTYDYLFPYDWDKALARLMQMIKSAEHKERTGEITPAVWRGGR